MQWWLDQLSLTSGWELLGVALAIVYLLLAARQNQACWVAAFISCVIYTQLMYSANLFMEAFLQACYVILAVYGWWQWQYGAGKAVAAEGEVGQPQYNWAWHLKAIGLLSILAALVGWLLARYTQAEAVWLDSFTTVFSLFATWLLTRKAIENWWYWLVIDSFYVYLYISKGFIATGLLFALYVVLVIYAIWQWRQREPQTSLG